MLAAKANRIIATCIACVSWPSRDSTLVLGVAFRVWFRVWFGVSFKSESL